MLLSKSVTFTMFAMCVACFRNCDRLATMVDIMSTKIHLTFNRHAIRLNYWHNLVRQCESDENTHVSKGDIYVIQFNTLHN